MTAIPTLAPEALAQRYALLCESTRPEPDEHMLAYSVEQGLQTLDKLLTGDLRTLARQGAPDDFADIHQALLQELERLREFCAFPALANKRVVAFGGGFSAGKSSLINALLGQKLLVTEVDPTTSLPTYLLHGGSNQVSALNLFGHRVALSEEAFLSLTHDEALLYGSHISRLLRAAFITRTDFAWPNLALIDTPGYSKDQSSGQTGTHCERTDEHIARAQLNAAQAVVWVIDARQGCITEDDLAFLGSLQRNIPLFIAISRADQKSEAEIPGIQGVIAAALKGRNIPVVGIAAFSARKPRAWPLDPLLQQFKLWNEQASQPQLAHSFQAGFARYDQFLSQQLNEAQDELNRLNRILALSDSREAQAEATHLKARAQTRLQALKTQGEQLETLWQTFGTQLAGLGKQVGMVLPTHGVLRMVVAAPVQVVKTAPTVPAVKRGPQPGDILCAGSGFPELVVLPGGSFLMGSAQAHEKPVHTVHVASFALGQYPVTQWQWKKVMGNNPSNFSRGGYQCPVENVSLDDVQAFIQELNQLTGHTYRLPSEAEWEYACRAGSTGQWCFGDDESQLKHYAWYDDNSENQTHPVREKMPNAFGLYDMHGNVREWCEDQWHGNYQGAPSDGRAWVDEGSRYRYRVLRGGSWGCSESDSRAPYRTVSHDIGGSRDGFRLARTVKAEPTVDSAPPPEIQMENLRIQSRADDLLAAIEVAPAAAPVESAFNLQRASSPSKSFWGNLADSTNASADTNSPQPGDILCAGSGFPELVVLPGASFQMGSNQKSNEQPIHTVRITSFAIGKYPVTQGQWKRVMGNNPSGYSSGGDQCPVENVSWDDAQDFIQKLNQQTGHTYRLPSEAEWEYACLAGSAGQWCFGDDESQYWKYAWYQENSSNRTHPAGGKMPNGFGLYDMHGNVWEWCEDRWHANYQGAPTDGRAWVDGDRVERLLRGGSWNYLASDSRAACRRNYTPSIRIIGFGFRLARTVKAEPTVDSAPPPEIQMESSRIQSRADSLLAAIEAAPTAIQPTSSLARAISADSFDLQRASSPRKSFWGSSGDSMNASVDTNSPRPGSVLYAGNGLPELVLLPGGSFQMGSTQDSDAQPVHTVNVVSFALGKYPVTQAQWKKVMGNNPSDFSSGGDQCPVENVSWDDAQAFIQKLNQQTGHTYRLPSEAEWEYACRAGNTGKWCFGDDESQLKHYAWYDDNSGRKTHPVGEKKANAFGLHDMHGNVWEWCEDQWHDNYQSAPSDGRAWVGGRAVDRVLRGGSWIINANFVRSAIRYYYTSDYRNSNFGFRVARTAP